MKSCEFLVIGAGIAGLRAAITLAQHGSVLLVTKEGFGESNTSYAQGGIAVARGGHEDIEEHWQDTLAAGAGLVNPHTARVLVEDGPMRVDELLAWQTGFDRDPVSGTLLLTREGAHSRNRILHANGDATGAEIGRALLARVRTLPAIEYLEWTTCADLLQDANGRVTGAVLLGREGAVHHAEARAVLLASGGAGQVYSDTTNPAVATGDGIAAAWRAGAVVADMEFYQFHPTALFLPGVPRFLLSEALRGEGARLINAAGERFMERYHPLLELAPRDVVARAITREAAPAEPGGASRPVYLDMRHVAREHPSLDLAARFPSISAFLAQRGLALARDPLPVRPAAHYLMGGVASDRFGRTSLPGLFAAGEVACTGVHGANRLASNSLLEGLVFGANAAEAMLGEPASGRAAGPAIPAVSPYALDARQELQAAMWRDAGLLRDAEGLRRAQAVIEDLRQHAEPKDAQRTRSKVEMRSLVDVSSLIVRSALWREESRGAHYRSDFPAPSERYQHSKICGDSPVESEPFVDTAATGNDAIGPEDTRRLMSQRFTSEHS